MRDEPPPDWMLDDAPSRDDARFAYWAFRPDDQPMPEWAPPDTFESEEDYQARMDGGSPWRFA